MSNTITKQKIKKYTNWSEATTKAEDAFLALITCIKAGFYNACVEVMKNGEQNFPIKEKNPALDKKESWTMMYGVPTESRVYLDGENYFNETEKDLTLNYWAAFGNPKTKEHKGVGQCFPLRKKGKYSGYWTTHWQPKQGIPYRVIRKINKVYVVVHDGKNDKGRIDKAITEVLKGLIT